MASTENGSSVLVVENDPNVLHLMRDYLTRAGFRISVAADGWEALKRLKETPVDLLVTDVDSAGVDGSSLRERIMLNPETRDLPIFLIVPEGNHDTLVYVLRSGVDDCITKPFDPVVLVARIQAVIARRKAYEEMVRVDPLTRLLNRPTLVKEVEEELSRINRYERTATMAILDVDDFVRVNTESGVAMGDLLLTCLSGVILSSMRTVDIAGRYHGDRSLLCLPETDEAGAERFIRRMQEQMGAIADSIAGYPLTFGCGIVLAPRDGDVCPILFERLDSALAEARQRGKGEIVVWRRDLAANVAAEDGAATE